MVNKNMLHDAFEEICLNTQEDASENILKIIESSGWKLDASQLSSQKREYRITIYSEEICAHDLDSTNGKQRSYWISFFDSLRNKCLQSLEDAFRGIDFQDTAEKTLNLVGDSDHVSVGDLVQVSLRAGDDLPCNDFNDKFQIKMTLQVAQDLTPRYKLKTGSLIA